MMQSVSSIQKFAKKRVILRLYSCFVTYMHKKVWDLTNMHRLRVVPACETVSISVLQPQATDSDSRRVWCYACRCALSLMPCIFFARLLPVV